MAAYEKLVHVKLEVKMQGIGEDRKHVMTESATAYNVGNTTEQNYVMYPEGAVKTARNRKLVLIEHVGTPSYKVASSEYSATTAHVWCAPEDVARWKDSLKMGLATKLQDKISTYTHKLHAIID